MQMLRSITVALAMVAAAGPAVASQTPISYQILEDFEG
jgi:hypothetical protein